MAPILPGITKVAHMRSAAATLVEILKDLSGEDLAALDRELSSGGFPTLSAMRNADERRVALILSSGRIRNEEEWQLIYARLADTASHWSAEQRARAEQLVAEFEEKR
jgi:hypothetical protein